MNGNGTLNGNFNGFTPMQPNAQSLLANSFMHSQIYPAVLDQLIESILDHMAKPKEVLVEVDENGNAVQV